MISLLQKAPEFKAAAVVGRGDFREVTLADYRGKYVMFFFYPLDFTFVCPTEIMEFSRRANEFKALNTQILGASCDSKFSHRAWLENGLGELNYPLLSDFTKEIATTYGCLLPDGFPTRATYIIDPEGVIQYISIHSPNVGRSVTETLRVLEAIQTGEKCPVEWRKGDKTLS
jgi:peroxiredoxin (alkyl hydroperoxide reductase subunit C)